MKNILKYILVASIAAPQLMVAMAEPAHAHQAQACAVCFENTHPIQLHANHSVCPVCFEDQITTAYNNRGAKMDALLSCPCMHNGRRCNYQITQADVARIAPAVVPQFQQIQQALAEKDKPAQIDRQNKQYLYAHTKPCPNCHRPIEKNGGCKWVVCAGCNTDFCYECLRISFGPGQRHRGHENHNLCIARDGWEGERAQLFKQDAPMLILGAIVVIAAVWGISELYEYFKKKKAKRSRAKNNSVHNGYQYQPHVHG